MIILLSPAKTLDFDTAPRTNQVTTPAFLDESEKLVTTLKKYKPKKEEFTFILIGLDGGIKLTKTEVLESSDLFSIIDAMPVRSSELRNKN